MPTFPTPEPIDVTLELAAGDARIVASERDDTVVEVVPRDPSRSADVRAAEQTRVELGDGRLLVKTPRPARGWSRGGLVDVTIALPAGSRLRGHTGAGDVLAEGTLGDCTFKTGTGALRFGHTGPAKLVSGAGDVRVEVADGTVLAVTGSGAVDLGRVAGHVVIKSGNGGATVGALTGDLRATTGNGALAVGHVAGTVVAKTAHGAIRIDAAEHGSVDLRTASGAIEIGVAPGTAARLDLRTDGGVVRQELTAAGGPPGDARTVTVKARTGFGDITVRRAGADGAAAA